MFGIKILEGRSQPPSNVMIEWTQSHFSVKFHKYIELHVWWKLEVYEVYASGPYPSDIILS